MVLLCRLADHVNKQETEFYALVVMSIITAYVQLLQILNIHMLLWSV